jgi:hypothetical protein
VHRTFRPGLDRLEAKALLSAGSGLVDSLTAVVNRTLAGPKVVETFTVTNVSSREISIDDGPGDGFSVFQGDKAVFNPVAGFTPQIITVHPLEPGQSYTKVGTWDGRSNLADPTDPGKEAPTLSGTFTISSGFDPAKTVSVTISKSDIAPVKAKHVVPSRPPAELKAAATLLPLPSGLPVGSLVNPSSG